jgi:hypothetical protein
MRPEARRWDRKVGGIMMLMRDGGKSASSRRSTGRMCERSVTNRGEERAESERRTEKMANEGHRARFCGKMLGAKGFCRYASMTSLSPFFGTRLVNIAVVGTDGE